ncbi:hypothetical protein JB92DRAFT_1577102 [Gautieria morchelliformis]|nr:hypothetical protein JB92DRAFT_1577102 [Gautieria morchelliformis]
MDVWESEFWNPVSAQAGLGVLFSRIPRLFTWQNGTLRRLLVICTSQLRLIIPTLSTLWYSFLLKMLGGPRASPFLQRSPLINLFPRGFALPDGRVFFLPRIIIIAPSCMMSTPTQRQDYLTFLIASESQTLSMGLPHYYDFIVQ